MDEVDAEHVVAAIDPLEFDPEEFTAPAGDVEIGLVNQGEVRHTLTIEGRERDLLLNTNTNGVDIGTIELEAGVYTFYCDVPGHRGAGMEGTLTVE